MDRQRLDDGGIDTAGEVVEIAYQHAGHQLAQHRRLADPFEQLAAELGGHENDDEAEQKGGDPIVMGSSDRLVEVAGGDRTSVPHGAVIEEPYDSLSFVPTVLALTGNLRDDNNPIPILWDKGFRRFPGRPIKELLAPR